MANAKNHPETRAGVEPATACTEVAIIGAGPAGLGCAAELGRRGVRVCVLEQADSVGPRWRARYDRLRLNTHRGHSELPGTSYPEGTGLYPTRDELVAHLEEHARQHCLDLRLRTRVTRLHRDGGDWTLGTSRGEVRARHVVVATGLAGRPRTPRWPGRERFRGRLLHSADYRNPAPFEGERVLVVGAGSSGMEIAHDLATSVARSVLLSVRTPPNILLRSVAGLPLDSLARGLLRLPPRLADATAAGLRRVTVGDLRAQGLPRPTEGPYRRLRRDGDSPAVVDREVIEALRRGAIEVVEAVESFDETAVRLRGGRRLEVDSVIAATGYECGLEDLLGSLEVLDGDGKPRRSDGREVAPGLRFIGFENVPGLIGRAVAQARAIAEEIARVGVSVPR